MGSSAFRKHHWETWNATIKIKSGWQILSEKWAWLAKEKVRSTWGPRYFFLPYWGSRCGQTAMQKYGMLAALPCWLSFYVGGDLASYDTSCRCLVYWRKRVPPLVSCQAGRFSHLPPLPYFFLALGHPKRFAVCLIFFLLNGPERPFSEKTQPTFPIGFWHWDTVM